MDFVSDALASGRRIKVLTIVDDFSKEAIDLAVDFGISGHYVTRALDQAARFQNPLETLVAPRFAIPPPAATKRRTRKFIDKTCRYN